MSCSPTSPSIVRRVIPYDLFAILLFNDKRKDLRIRYAVGHREEVVRNLSLALGEGIVGDGRRSAASRFWWPMSRPTTAI